MQGSNPKCLADVGVDPLSKWFGPKIEYLPQHIHQNPMVLHACHHPNPMNSLLKSQFFKVKLTIYPMASSYFTGWTFHSRDHIPYKLQPLWHPNYIIVLGYPLVIKQAGLSVRRNGLVFTRNASFFIATLVYQRVIVEWLNPFFWMVKPYPAL